MVIRTDPATGVLKATLAVVWRQLPVPTSATKANTLPLRTWQVLEANGVSYADADVVGFPGPTFRVRQGDSVEITLINQLTAPPVGTDTACMQYPAAYTTDRMQDCFHGANWTNIHYHGMHVTPRSNGDDVLLEIAPGETYRYNFRIPANQSPGTHWYHPHKHGSVALQVLNGMSGAFIVEGGGLDSLAAAHNMLERLIALQQIDTQPNIIRDFAAAPEPTTLVNGAFAPVILMAPGEVQRWRIVNENITKSTNFQLFFPDTTGVEPTMYDVARDGVQYAPANYSTPGQGPRADTSLIMAPGNRLDVFVQAPRNGGVFPVSASLLSHADTADRTRKEDLDPGPGVQRPVGFQNRAAEDRQGQGRNQGRGQGRARVGAAVAAAAPVPLFYVKVDPTLSPRNSSLPASLPQLPGFLGNLTGEVSPDSIPIIVFADSGFGRQTPTVPTRFFLGDSASPYRKFNVDSVYVPLTAQSVPMPMVLADTQTWKVENQSAAANHPFHIHINPFQVMDVVYGSGDPMAPLYAQLESAAAGGNPIWLDVLPLPKPFKDASGTTVPGYAIIRQAYEP
ncbi:MAG TPA: multicopper oxidase domain-containing protein, partial [Longimicrobium sp.]|nr:multicopper oxidase domain-containing protein [Longimicrobium sp.]